MYGSPLLPLGHDSLKFKPDSEASSSRYFIPAVYSEEGSSARGSTVRLLPFRRNVIVNSQKAYRTDFDQFEWLLRYGTTEVWYEKPSEALLKRMGAADLASDEPEKLHVSNIKPAVFDTPKVWASAALTTPIDNDAHGCTAGHAPDATTTSYRRICQQCTDARFEGLNATDLTYSLVFKGVQASDAIGSRLGGQTIFQLVKCGSRETAIAEIFHAVGLNGWNLVFSCVTRADQKFRGRSGELRRVKDLWLLAKDDDDAESVRVFY